MGVVALPSRVTGLAAISISEEITFMPGCQASSNSSQYGLDVGVFWRLILIKTVLLAISRFFSWSPGRPRPGGSATKLVTGLPLRWADEGVRPSTSKLTSLRHTSSPAAESATHPPARTQTSAHPHPERNTPLSSSGNSYRRGRGNPACNAPRVIPPPAPPPPPHPSPTPP